VDAVWIDGQMIRVKVSANRVKAEYEDVALAARRTGQPVRELAFRAEAQWRVEHGRSDALDDDRPRVRLRSRTEPASSGRRSSSPAEPTDDPGDSA
jgi:hypothetical protein